MTIPLFFNVMPHMHNSWLFVVCNLEPENRPALEKGDCPGKETLRFARVRLAKAFPYLEKPPSHK